MCLCLATSRACQLLVFVLQCEIPFIFRFSFITFCVWWCRHKCMFISYVFSIPFASTLLSLFLSPVHPLSRMYWTILVLLASFKTNVVLTSLLYSKKYQKIRYSLHLMLRRKNIRSAHRAVRHGYSLPNRWGFRGMKIQLGHIHWFVHIETDSSRQQTHDGI